MRWLRHLYVQVLLGVAAGVLVGTLRPDWGRALEPLGLGFVALVKMIIAPIIFCTVVHGLASMRDLRKLGRIGGKALLYFEVVSTFALIIGLIVVNVLQPGAGFHADLHKTDPTKALSYAEKAHALGTIDFLMKIIPDSFVGAFTSGNLLQVLLLAALTAFALNSLGQEGERLLHAIELGGKVFFAIMSFVVKLAPLGAFGAMAFTVGSFGLQSLQHLALLMAGFYLTAGIFVVCVLGSIARAAGFSIFRFIYFIRDELLLVLGTSSSETALPGLIRKMRALGCAESTVGLVIPTGYSFNLDGTNIYMTMASLFLAQALGIHLDLQHQLGLLAVAIVSSKGASAVTGSGLITLAATLAAVPEIPVESLALIVGIDRFMSECRSLTNLIGNGVATVVVSRWEGEVTGEELRARLAAKTSTELPA